MFGKIVAFFKKVGGAVKAAAKWLMEHIPDEQLIAAIEIVGQAGENFLSNVDRRNWAIEQLMARFPIISESTARILVELALKQIKKGIDALEEKAADAVTEQPAT